MRPGEALGHGATRFANLRSLTYVVPVFFAQTTEKRFYLD